MKTPFPGMDPYLEHPALWTGIHARLLVALANQLGPQLLPRYVASVEERVFLETPGQQRVPDLWVQKLRDAAKHALSPATATLPLIVEVEELEVREHFIEILDLYRDQHVVTVLEVVSPSNKSAGPGRDAYEAKQRATLASEAHLVEIDLLRRGRHVLSVPEIHSRGTHAYDYLSCVSRWPKRKRFELYPCLLRDPLPNINVPLVEPDADVVLDVQGCLEQVYQDGGYAFRVRYDEPCHPPLEPADQEWANQCWSAYKAAHPDLFPSSP